MFCHIDYDDYIGRIAVGRIFQGRIRSGQPVNAIRTVARKAGMLYLQEIGLQKVIEGVTSMNEILRALRDE